MAACKIDEINVPCQWVNGQMCGVMDGLLIQVVRRSIQCHLAREQVDDLVFIIATANMPEQIQVAPIRGGAMAVTPPAGADVDGVIPIPDHAGPVICQGVEPYIGIPVGIGLAHDTQASIRRMKQAAVGPGLAVQERFAAVKSDQCRAAVHGGDAVDRVIARRHRTGRVAHVQPA